MVITAESEALTLAALRKRILEDARRLDKQARFEEEEKRTLNGREVLVLKWTVKTERGTNTFLGCLYSGEGFSIELIIWANEKVFAQKRAELVALLNGFEVTKSK
jgi:hypothetical protein